MQGPARQPPKTRHCRWGAQHGGAAGPPPSRIPAANTPQTSSHKQHVERTQKSTHTTHAHTHTHARSYERLEPILMDLSDMTAVAERVITDVSLTWGVVTALNGGLT